LVEGLEARLRSRFQGGLIVDIHPPDQPTRMAILLRKAALLSIEFDPSVFEFLAAKNCDNVRELEGSLNRIAAYAKLIRTPRITLATAEAALSAFSPQTPPSIPQPLTVINSVARFFSLPPDALTGQNRSKLIADARHIAIFLLREHCHLQLKEIGKLFGNRDHTSIIHAHRKISALMKHDPHLQRQLAEIRQRFQEN
ncbi:MAG TPA: helix-turn-helix domain-containing protein, partial [Dehalococcoidia bacterium]|nr:helix-turn-helix domain-containing protein [Dehalococcoidia bacterium]